MQPSTVQKPVPPSDRQVSAPSSAQFASMAQSVPVPFSVISRMPPPASPPSESMMMALAVV